jgi:hypothetical protein
VFFVFCLFFFFPYLVLSVAPEEVLALLFLLHRENGDFSILMKDICFKFSLVQKQALNFRYVWVINI